MELKAKSYRELQLQLDEAHRQLEEANDAIEAIRTGQIDALVVEDSNGHQLFTLRSADQSYRVFIEKMTEGALTLNKDGIILYCNSQFASMVGMAISSVIGFPFRNYISSATLDVFTDIFRKCWDKDCKGELLLNGENKETPVLLSLTSLEIDGEISLSVIITDLTELKKNQLQLEAKNHELEVTNKALESSNQDLQQFASVASHDLQEPLRKIQMFSELLKKKGDANLSLEAGKYLSKIESSAARMKNLVIDILNYSGLSSTSPAPESLNLREVVTEVLEDMGPAYKPASSSVLIGDLPSIRGNRGQIRQVFQNVISNALKFMPAGKDPEVRISAIRIAEKSFESAEDVNGSFVRVSVRDNGIGFDELYLPNIFNLFERLHSKDAYEGTGIGLALTKKIIEKHGGLITAKSQLGNGAEFVFVMQVA